MPPDQAAAQAESLFELERYGECQRARVDLGIGMFDENWNEIVRTNEIREFHPTACSCAAVATCI